MARLPEETRAARLQRALDLIPHEGNRKTVERFLREREANGAKSGTLANEVAALRDFCRILGQKALEDVTREDVAVSASTAEVDRTWRNKHANGDFTETAKPVKLAPSTRAERKKVVKHFFRWLRGTEDYPPEVSWLKTSRPSMGKIPTDRLITEADLRSLIQTSPDKRSKALIAVMYESGMRAGEICALDVGSVIFDQYGAVLTLPLRAEGLKTGARRVRLLDTWQILHEWWEAHPQKADPRAPLFPTYSGRRYGARLTPHALWWFVRHASSRAGLQKPIKPHLFRHSAATERARLGWSEHQMRAYFGWSAGSDEPSYYTHLAGQDYEKMLLQSRGLLKPGEQARPAAAPLQCKVCEALNDMTAMFCSKCRNPVSPEAEAELDRRRHEDLKGLIAAEIRSLWERERSTLPKTA